MSSKNTFSRLAPLLVPAVLSLPGVDATVSAGMTGKALIEPAALLAAGALLAATGTPPPAATLAPLAVAAAALLSGFWMIPRSIDLTQASSSANALYIASLFVVGVTLRRYAPLLPGTARLALGLLASSMLVTMGLVYLWQTTLLCAAYTLQSQHAFGGTLIPVGLALYGLVLARTMAPLTRPARHSTQRDPGPAHPLRPATRSARKYRAP